jgi:Undecaprenyl-phosphate glucose phosphotransferase
MLKQKRQLFEALFMVSDLVVVTACWLLSYWLRFETDWIAVDKGVPAFTNYLSMTIFILVIWSIVFKQMGLYKPMRGIRSVREVWLLINANTLALLLFIAITYLVREKSVPFSRLVFVYFGILSTFFTLVQRICLRTWLRELRRRGYNLRYMLIVGAGQVASDLAERIRNHKELGIQLVGCLVKNKDQNAPENLPILGQYEDLGDVLSRMDIDQVVLALPLEDSPLIPQMMNLVIDSLVDVKVVPDLYRFVSLGGSIEEFEGLPVIGVQESRMNLSLKRIVDLILSSVLILLFSPLLILISLLVKLTSRGPVFYIQERVSYDGSAFGIFKFRTMVVNAEENGAAWTTKEDARVTSLGRFLRSSSLDELPQLFNVFFGDMSLIGPRPERPVFIEEFRKDIPRYMLRHKVPAGMTGWAQVNGWRGDTSISKRIEYDLYYIENWSLLLDLKILILTFFRGFKNKNAY